LTFTNILVSSSWVTWWALTQIPCSCESAVLHLSCAPACDQVFNDSLCRTFSENSLSLWMGEKRHSLWKLFLK